MMSLKTRATLFFVLARACAAAWPTASAGEADLGKLPPPPVVLARVGSTIITQRDIDELLVGPIEEKLAVRRAVERSGGWNDAAEEQFGKLLRGLETEVRRELLRRALFAESARKSGYQPDEVMIEARLRAAVGRAGGAEALERERGRTVEQFRDELRRADLRTRFYVDFLPHSMMPGPGKIREYYEANRARLQVAPSVKLRILQMPTGPDREVARYRADGVRLELQHAPHRFETRLGDFAKTEEEKARAGLLVDPNTGEVMEWVSANTLARPLREAIEGLRPGAVSNLIEFGDVFALVKLDGYRPPEPIPLEKVSEDILKVLQRAQEAETVQVWSDYYLREVYVADGNGRRISAESFVGE